MKLPKAVEDKMFNREIVYEWIDTELPLGIFIQNKINSARADEQEKIISKLFPTEEKRYYGIKLTLEELKQSLTKKAEEKQ